MCKCLQMSLYVIISCTSSCTHSDIKGWMCEMWIIRVDSTILFCCYSFSFVFTIFLIFFYLCLSLCFACCIFSVMMFITNGCWKMSRIHRENVYFPHYHLRNVASNVLVRLFLHYIETERFSWYSKMIETSLYIVFQWKFIRKDKEHKIGIMWERNRIVRYK